MRSSDIMNLNGDWSLTYFPQETLISASPLAQGSKGKSISARVPGNVELDMVEAGELEQPFLARNIEALQAYEGHEWWFEREFVPEPGLEGGRVNLVFHGVDTFATYWLNGEHLGDTANMLVEHTFDVSDRLRFGTANTLTVRVRSSAIEARNYPYPAGIWAGFNNYMGLHVRKAPHMYGWDIMPRALSAGIWRDVELVPVPPVGFKELYCTTLRAGEADAVISISYDLDFPGFVPNAYSVRARLRKKGALPDSSPCAESKAVLPFTAGRFELWVGSPELWWPLGYGEQPLYDLEISIVPSDGTDAAVAVRHEIVGIRRIELIRSDSTSLDAKGNTVGEFMFRVNGTPVLVKGSNWVPADAFHSRDKGRIPQILALFRDLGCNMARCWGGNVYEDDVFYRLCDEWGIMVWQDFAMACAWYPQDDAFADTLRQEAEKVVRRLRNHPCIALWSGDNECDEAFVWNGLMPPTNRLTREVLPNVIRMHDPYRSYLPSSPYFSQEAIAMGGSRFIPEQHLWGPRDYFKSPYYTDSTAHFVSEQGYHGCPNVSSIREFISPDALWPYSDNREWQIHATDPVLGGSGLSNRIDLMANQTRELFGSIPDNLQDFALASQVSQAEALKFFIEMTRLRKWRRTGILWWNVMDGWPQFSDAIVDYYFGRKLAYHYIRRVQQPACPMMAEPMDWACKVVVGNDSRRDLKGFLEVSDTDGRILLKRDVSAPANTNAVVGSLDISRGVPIMYLLRLHTAEGIFVNHYCKASPPLSLSVYKEWLKAIAGMDGSFDADTVGL